MKDDTEEQERRAEELRREIAERGQEKPAKPSSPREFIAQKMTEAAKAEEPASADEPPDTGPGADG